VVTTIVHNPTANDRVEYFGQIVNAFVDTTVEFSASHCLTDGFRGSIAHAWTEVDEGGEALRDAEAVLDFAQGEQPAVGAQVPGIEPGDDRLAADR
jgi:hypothetical protein